jgi:hypothetical protein
MPIYIKLHTVSNGKCERGYRAAGEICEVLTLPVNAHIDYSGNDWECNKPYKKLRDKCILP